MPIKQTNYISVVQRLFRWIKNQVIQDVPKDIAVREYNCRRGQCMQDEWETCARRLSASTGELKPFSIH